MKTTASIFFAVVFAVMLSAPTRASTEDIGNAYVLHTDLLAFVAVENGAATTMQGADATEALGYVAGVADVLNGTIYCSPGGVSRGQLLHIVLKFMDANPEQWQVGSALIVGRALRVAFPCPTKAK